MNDSMIVLVLVAAVMFCVLGGIPLLAHIYSLNGIKSKTVGDGQHGTARWATKSEIRKTYHHIPYTPEKWRKQAAKGQVPTASRIIKNRPFRKKKNNDEILEEALPQGIVVGCTGGKNNATAMVDTGDVHALMIGAAGVGKTAYRLFPCIEYACTSGMSWRRPRNMNRLRCPRSNRAKRRKAVTRVSRPFRRTEDPVTHRR